MAAVAVEAITRPDPDWRPAAVGVGCALAVAVLIRRTHGLAAVALTFGAFVVVDVAAAVLAAEPVVLFSGLVVLLLAYSLCRWGGGCDVVLGLGVVPLGFTVSVVTDFSGSEDALGGAAASRSTVPVS